MKHYILLSLSLGLLIGCNRKETSSIYEITENDIANALQMRKWNIQVPDELPAGKRLALKLSHRDQEREIANIGSEKGKVTKIIMWSTGAPDQIQLYTEWPNGSGSYGIVHDKVFSLPRGWNDRDRMYGIGDTLLGDSGDNPTFRVYVGEVND